MILTKEVISRYKNGQLEIQNQSEGYLYRGEIKNIEIQANDGRADLRVEFRWMAKFVEGEWVNSPENLKYVISLSLYVAFDIDLGRVALESFITGELAVLFPPDGSKLDPVRVKRLVL